jgi:thiamine kinase-like enzyme
MIKKWLESRREKRLQILKDKIQEEKRYVDREEREKQQIDELYELADKLNISFQNERIMYLTLLRFLDNQEQRISNLEKEK